MQGGTPCTRFSPYRNVIEHQLHGGNLPCFHRGEKSRRRLCFVLRRVHTEQMLCQRVRDFVAERPREQRVAFL